MEQFTIASAPDATHFDPMIPDIYDSADLILRLSAADENQLPVSFLVGAPFSTDGDDGVPGIDGFIDIMRQRVTASGPAHLARFEEKIAQASGADRYQAAMGVIHSILPAAARSGAVLTDYWRKIVLAAAAVSKDVAKADQIGETYSQIVHGGIRLHRNLPAALDQIDQYLRGDIGIAAAEAAHEAIPEWSSVTAALARALRSGGYPKDGADLLALHFPTLTQMTVDWEKNIRGYLCEWATCHSQISRNSRQSRLANAWLDSVSLCDRLPVVLEPKQARQSCTGLAHAYDHLGFALPNDVVARGHRAVIALGARLLPDDHLRGVLQAHRIKLDRHNVPVPADDAQLFSWIAEAAAYAWAELTDPAIRLQANGILQFTKLQRLVASA